MATRPARTPFDRVPPGEHKFSLSVSIAQQNATIQTIIQRAPLAALAFDPDSFPLVKMGLALARQRAAIDASIHRAHVVAYRPRS